MTEQTVLSAPGAGAPQIKPPYVLKFAQPDPTSLRLRLLEIWREMGPPRRAAFETLHAADGKPAATQLATVDALCLAGDFAFLLAAVVRRAEEYRAAPDGAELEPFADFLERVIGLVLDTGLDWLEEANDDLLGDVAGDRAQVAP